MFYLGLHEVRWMEQTGVPLFWSYHRLRKRKSLPRAMGPWVLDSGGFTELSRKGAWTISQEEYIARVRRFRDDIGSLQWAACQDWMCEPQIIDGGMLNGRLCPGTKLSVRIHQERTVASYVSLMAADSSLPWVPVIQGYKPAEYLEHVAMYGEAGVNLASLPIVGVGSICRRQATAEAADIIESIADRGIQIHAFGLKTLGLPRVAGRFVSSDSMAWSYAARRSDPLPGCRHGRPGKPRPDGKPGSCANCLRYALRWREKVLAAAAAPRKWSQTSLAL